MHQFNPGPNLGVSLGGDMVSASSHIVLIGTLELLRWRDAAKTKNLWAYEEYVITADEWWIHDGLQHAPGVGGKCKNLDFKVVDTIINQGIRTWDF